MIKIINIENAEKSDILTRDIKLESGVENIVSDIIANVKENGDKALKEYALKFDKAEIENLRVTSEEIEKAYEDEDKAFIETLEIAKKKATVAIVDLLIGIYTLVSTWNSVAPSTMAASSISEGTPSNALRRRIIFIAAIPMAITTSHLSSVIPILLNTSCVSK